jgi:exonuclease VII small subunit
MKGKQIYEIIKKLEDAKDELNEALGQLEDNDMRHSRAYTVVHEERNRVTKELDEAQRKDWLEPPRTKALHEDIF